MIRESGDQLRSPLRGWIWRMAWRESRSSRKRLLLFTSSIVLGVAALVAISSLRENLSLAIDQQARSLLGADLALRSSSPFSEAAEALFTKIGGDRSRNISLSSMAYFPKNRRLRLVQVRAVEGGYPYYGELETIPAGAISLLDQGNAVALVDDTLMKQFDLEIGDQIRIGEIAFEIEGRLLSIPGESLAFSVAAPRVFIPFQFMPRTGLIQVGSQVSYRIYFKLPKGTDVESLVDEERPVFEQEHLRPDTVERRKRSLGRAMSNLYRFLNLVGFIALLLGGIGIASAIHLYIRQKLSTVAILRCLGCSSRQTLGIYAIQALAMGALGTLAGSSIGMGVQYLLPSVLADFLPLDVQFTVSPGAIARASLIGLGFALLFALLPLLPIRRVSPLVVLRAAYEDTRQKADPLQWAIKGLIAGAILTFAISQTNRWFFGVWFFVGLLAAFGLLAGVAAAISYGARRLLPRSWPFVWRQGVANLYRPNNQTLVLMMALGLGTFLLTTLYFVQGTLLSHSALTGREDNPNLVLFDIQSDQIEPVREILQKRRIPILIDVPMVPMRLSSINGETIEDIESSPHRRASRWALSREYRSTYRSTLAEGERLVSGRWIGRYEGEEPIPISLEEGIGRDLGVELGDTLVFDVQGVPVKCRVSSFRDVDWERVQPNFFAVFPEGVLEEAPQFHVIVSRTQSAALSASVQREIIERFPNISAIDLALVLSIVETILDKVSFVIRFMALFSILTGLAVLVGAVLTSRYQRMRETVLLRTLGASSGQIVRILVVEYLMLGIFATLTGLCLALAGSWALAHFIFESELQPQLLPASLSVLVIIGSTILIGIFNSRGTVRRPPLEVLREEPGAF